MLATAASSPIAYWYLTRATGVVALVLLTITVALGVANVKRLQTKRIPRFVIDSVHRNASMLAVVFLALHVTTTLADSYIPIHLADVIVPFGAGYRPFWVGLGAVSLDLLVAVMVTSLLRRRIGHRIWRATHWLAYASWPVALSHSLGTGSDAGTPWMLALTAVCVTVVAIAVAIRLRQEPEAPTPRLRRHRVAPNVRRAARPQTALR
jgi:sulfoxide reductase heme-binding subunit YedZ